MKKLFKKLLVSVCIIGILLGSIGVCSAVGYNDIQKNCDRMTCAQFDEYKETLINTRINWIGKVTDVTKNWFNSDYTVYFDVDGNSYDVSQRMPKQSALSYMKGQSYYIRGTIKQIISVFGAVVVTIK